MTPRGRRSRAASRHGHRKIAALLPFRVWREHQDNAGNKSGSSLDSTGSKHANRSAESSGGPETSHSIITVLRSHLLIERLSTAGLRQIGLKVLPSPDEPEVLRFADNYDITVELKPV